MSAGFGGSELSDAFNTFAESLQALRAPGFVTDPNSTAPRVCFLLLASKPHSGEPHNPRVRDHGRAMDSQQYKEGRALFHGKPRPESGRHGGAYAALQCPRNVPGHRRKEPANARALCLTGQTDAHPMDMRLFTGTVHDLSTDLLSARTGELRENTWESLLLPSFSLLAPGDSRDTANQFCMATALDRTQGEGTWRASVRRHGPLQWGPRTPDSIHTQDPLRTFVREPGPELASAPGSTRGATARARCSCSTDLLPRCRDLVLQTAQDHASRCKCPSPPRAEKPSSAHGAVTPGPQHGHAVCHRPAADCPSL